MAGGGGEALVKMMCYHEEILPHQFYVVNSHRGKQQQNLFQLSGLPLLVSCDVQRTTKFRVKAETFGFPGLGLAPF